MRRLISVIFIFTPLILGAQNGLLEYPMDSINALLEQPLDKAQRVKNILLVLDSAPSWPTALKYLEELKSDKQIWNSPELKRYHLFYEVTKNILDKDIEKGLELMKLYVEACDREKLIMGMRSPLGSIRNLFRSLDKNEEIKQYYKEKLDFYKINGPEDNIAICYHGLGGYYFFSGNYNSSITNYLKASEYFKGYPYNYGAEMAVIGSGYEKWGNFQKAIEYSEKAIPFLMQVKAYGPVCLAQTNLVRGYKQQKNYTKALSIALKTLDLLEQEKLLNVYKVTTLLEVGDIYILLNQMTSAQLYLEQAATLTDSLNISLMGTSGFHELDYVFFRYFTAKNKPKKAVQKLRAALLKAENGRISPLKKKYLKEMAHFYDDGDNHKMAAKFAFERMSLSDSLEQANNKNAIAEYEMQQNEQEAIITIQRIEKQRKIQVRNLLFGGAFLLLVSGGFYSRMRYIRKSRALIEKEKNRSEKLLLNILPYDVAQELKTNGKIAAKEFNAVSVIFSDFKGFTQATEFMSAHQLVSELNICFEAFDHITDKYKIEKIKTIGDAYMAASGLSNKAATSTKNAILAALEMQAFIRNRKTELSNNSKHTFEMRIGIHTGPVIAGVVGVKKFQYDIWGDTVNTASRMESNGAIEKVNISESTFKLLQHDPEFIFKSRGKIKVKGKGEMEMYFVGLMSEVSADFINS